MRLSLQRCAGGSPQERACGSGASGGHAWAERYEASLGDIFSVQDEITRSIALALQIKLTYGETVRLWEGQTRDLRAWEKMVEARGLYLRFNKADNARSRQLLEEAIRIDPATAAPSPRWE